MFLYGYAMFELHHIGGRLEGVKIQAGVSSSVMYIDAGVMPDKEYRILTESMCKLGGSGLNARYRGTAVAKH